MAYLAIREKCALSPLSHGNNSPDGNINKKYAQQFCRYLSGTMQDFTKQEKIPRNKMDWKEDQPFVWHKKLKKEGLGNLSCKDLIKLHKKKLQANAEEIRKAAATREARDHQKWLRRQETENQQIQREDDAFKDWIEREDEFLLKQVPLRSKIRLEKGTAKPIDHLANYAERVLQREAYAGDNDSQKGPLSYLEHVSIEDLEDLLADIGVYRKIHIDRPFQEYWDHVENVVKYALMTNHGQSTYNDQGGDAYRSEQQKRPAIHTSLINHVTSLFHGKNCQQLDLLERNVKNKIQKREKGVDLSYWEELLGHLQAHTSRTKLQEIHSDYLSHFHKEDKSQISTFVAGSAHVNTVHSSMHNDSSVIRTHFKPESGMLDVFETVISDGELEDTYDYKVSMLNSPPPGVCVVTEEEDNERLKMARMKVTGFVDIKQEGFKGNSGQRKTLKQSKRLGDGLQCGESIFNEEIELHENIDQTDLVRKLTPKKPLFYNRVHTGYQWNRYNRTHYTSDNPPPKTVTGYKFNIFYPDLVHKNTVPGYSITPCGEDPGLAVLRFHAGSPYQDVAFKVVHREWDRSSRHGYRCSFNGKCLQLWFKFKRLIYKR